MLAGESEPSEEHAEIARRLTKFKQRQADFTDGVPGGDPDWLAVWESLLSLHIEKSSGYGTGDDPLANFTSVAALSGEPAWLYPLRRSVEKLARCESLYRQGRTGDLAEEFKDIASLALCASALLKRLKKLDPGYPVGG